MSQREAALNLEWTPWDNLEWGANLPPIPGYPGTRYDGNVYAVVEPSAINGDAYGFHLHISINADDNIVLDNRDFDIPDGTADEMMAAVDDLSLRDIANMLDDMGYGPIGNPTASRHASKRTAALDLDWYYLQQNGFWHADLPTIPGYTYQTAHPSANVLPVYSATGRRKDEWKLQMGFDTIVDGGVTLTNNSFGIPNTETAEEMMQAVDNLSVEEISQTLSDCGYYAYFEDEPEYHHDGYWNTLSGEWVGSHRKDAHAHHATRRQARLNLQWYDELDDYDHLFYYAELPEVPGYTDAEESESYAQVYLMEDYSDIPETPGYEKGAWGFHLYIDSILGDRNLYADDFGLPAVESADEAMSMVDNLSMQDIIDRVASGPATASRKATRRKADMSLDWMDDGDDAYSATLPPIPGYTEETPNSVAPGSMAVVWVYRELVATRPNPYYTGEIRIQGRKDIPVLDLYFPLGMRETAEEMMFAVELLTPEDIARMWDEYGDQDENW